jgi:hypothetical protein
MEITGTDGKCQNVSLKVSSNTVLSKSRCALRLGYVDLVQACIDARGHYFQLLSERRSAESVCE